jgi:hypothetical protein
VSGDNGGLDCVEIGGERLGYMDYNLLCLGRMTFLVERICGVMGAKCNSK